MALPRPPLNPEQPIPNNPFFSPQINIIQGSTGPLIVGTGLSIDYTTGIISTTGGGGGISSVTGLAPITVTGTTDRVISIAAASTTSAGAVIGCTNGSNSALGCNALLANTTGVNNVAIGNAASCSNTIGSGNVAVGALAGSNITTGSSNVAIGTNVTVPFGNQSCQLAIGYNTSQYWLTGDSSKNVKFWAGIRVNDDSLGSSGQVLTSTGSGVAWASASGVPSWTFVGTMGGPGSPVILTTSNGGNTTVTGSYNGVWTQQIGSKTWNVIYQYRASGASVGYTNGEADFVFQLPGTLSFDTNLLFQKAFTGSVRDSSQANRAYFLPGASSTQFNAGSTTGSQNGSGIIVWSGNQFRFMIATDPDNGPRAWGTSYWNNVDTAINIGFQFQTP